MPEMDISFCRSQFPALDLLVNGRPIILLDGPGGTQVPRRVIDRMVTYLTSENANVHGPWQTSRATDRAVEQGRRALADFLGASPDEIAFGQNMTTLNYALSRALGRRLAAGDEVVITELDHEGNRAPWLALEEKGVTVRQVRVDPGTCTLDLNDFEAKLSPRTRIVAVGGASNGVGTVNDLHLIRGIIEEAAGGADHGTRGSGAPGGRAVFVVDAVHLAPHKPIDVRAIGCDYLLCSPYKFFGPHLGVLYGRREAFERLEVYKLRSQSDSAPFRIETGTLVHEGIAGATEAVEFIADIGRKASGSRGPGSRNRGSSTPLSRRQSVVLGIEAIDAHEQKLADWFIAELEKIDGLKIYGPPKGQPRTPTISFRLAGRTPESLSEDLASQGICAGAGDFYATTLMERLGIAGKPGPDGEPRDHGVLRMGLAPYNTKTELERVLDTLKRMPH